MSAEPITVAWLLNKAWVLLVAIMWYGKRNLDLDNKSRDKEIRQLKEDSAVAKSKYVTELQMKEAIREQLEPYKEDQQEIKLLLRSLNEQIIGISKEMAVQNAVRKFSENKSSEEDK